ncbi:MAG TPA: class I SAM-dependent methyltransferase [Nitrospiria bacterium]|nr:class I SAM-dependent methyltransferase [Nitrospiria bacterium]
MAPFALSTRLRFGLNAILKPIGLELVTTRTAEQETRRLKGLQERKHWNKARYDQGLHIQAKEHLRLMERVCTPFRGDYSALPKTSSSAQKEFFLENGWFGAVDAEVLYSIIRHYKPGHIIEVGSGFTTLLMRKAIEDGNLKTKLTAIDPSPHTEVVSFVNEHVRLPVEDLDITSIIDSLRENDILFIDSSHTVMTGGDVPYLYLEILPRLRKGVLIHVHDIFLPFDYPEKWILDQKGWTEQYLAHAFLCFNSSFEIIWPARYMWEIHRNQIETIIPSAGGEITPASLWLRKVE